MNKIQTRIISLLVAITITIGLLPGLKVNASVVASGDCGANGDNVSWTLDDAETLTISGAGAIAESAFSNNAQVKAQVKTVVIEEGITGIGGNAFKGCTSLESVTVPVSVESIGDNAFADCTALTSFEADATLLQKIDVEKVFANSDKVSFVACTYKITYNTCSFGAVSGPGGAAATDEISLNVSPELGYVVDTVTFTDNKGTTTTITPDSDGKYSFTMPSGEVTVGAAFKQLGTNANIVDSGTCGEGVNWTLDDNGTLTISGSGEIDSMSFSYNEEIVNVIIKDGITGIGAAAFGNCQNLTSITIPSSVENIGSQAFLFCYDLTSVSLSDGLQTLGDSAFSNCTSLESVYLPSSVNSIGYYAFDNCEKLVSVTMDKALHNSINSNVFRKCPSNLQFYYHKYDITYDSGENGTVSGENGIVKSASSETVNLIVTPSTNYVVDKVTVTDSTGTKTIYPDANDKYSFIMPSGAAKVTATFKQPQANEEYDIEYDNDGNGTVSGVTTAKSGETINLTITPEEDYVVKEVTYFANGKTNTIYTDSSGKYSFVMPSGDTKVSATFQPGGSCGTDVTWIIDDNGTLTISGSGDMEDYTVLNLAPWYNFRRNIKQIVISNGVTSIGDNAFFNCNWVESVTVPDSVKSIGEGAFLACIGIKELEIPYGVEVLESSVFYGCHSLESITIPNSVTTIGDNAFSGCESLNSISIPVNVNSIGALAFHNCKYLTSITIPDSVQDVGDNAFLNCDKLLTTDNSINIDKALYDANQSAFPDIPDSSFNFTKYTITYGTSANGTVSGVAESPSATEITVTVAPDPNYVVDTVTVTDSTGTNTISLDSNNNYSFTMPSEDVSVEATFKLDQKTITFANEDGTVLQSGKVDCGTIPSYSGATPTKATDDQYTYTFSGWTPAIAPVTADATYTATFTKTAKPTPAPATPAPTPDPTPVADEEVPAIVSGIVHVQDVGNVTTYMDPETGFLYLGTEGQGKRLESITLYFDNPTEYSGTLEYRVHVQDIGWTDWVTAGNPAGTEGMAKRIEAIEIRLTGELADYYSVFYGVHIQDYGDMQGWVQDGALAGTTGESKRIEALAVVIVPKGMEDNISVQYRVHVQDYGWESSYAADGKMAGTSGQSKRLEGIEMFLTGCPYSGGIQYKTHIQDIGWENGWTKNGEMSGTQGQSKRLEGICIELYGEVAEYYDIYYRVHAQDIGWMAWAKNGECAGTAGRSARLEGIQIVLVPKGDPAPGATYEGITAVTDKAFIEGF